jgi:hypothetical protein
MLTYADVYRRMLTYADEDCEPQADTSLDYILMRLKKLVCACACARARARARACACACGVWGVGVGCGRGCRC